jgi:predicted Zn-ribbon and HTH transcriptional regulator
MDAEEQLSAQEWAKLVDQNGLTKLFANRVRARVLVTLFYADEPLTAEEIASTANMYQSAVLEAMDPLEQFDILDKSEPETSEEAPRFALTPEDELVEHLQTTAKLATERLYD